MGQISSTAPWVLITTQIRIPMNLDNSFPLSLLENFLHCGCVKTRSQVIGAEQLRSYREEIM